MSPLEYGRNVVIIVGAGRSGSTILSQVLGRHPAIFEWYEPYFIWDDKIGNLENDVRTKHHATDEVKKFIRHEFEEYRKKSGKAVVIDKYPPNSFRIPFIHEIFPEAKWIHLIRHGMDVTWSLYRQSQNRRRIVERRDWFQFWGVVREMMGLQPFWRNRFQAICFELKTGFHLDPMKYLNRSKFQGRIGYGPRFPGWEEAIERFSSLEFHALQWVQSVESVMRDSQLIPTSHWLDIHYEDLIERPQEALNRILQFFEYPSLPVSVLWPDLDTTRVGRWKSELSVSQLESVQGILDPVLLKLGYPPCSEALSATIPIENT